MELQVRSDNGFIFNNVNNPPFSDIRVRRAMQMALDLETISETFFSGLADPTPHGPIDNSKIGVGTPFEEWPEEIKQYYRHDPEGAKQLLAEAGYPDGFKTRLDYTERFDISYAELAANYWREIGVEVEIHTIDNTQSSALARDNSSDGMLAFASAFSFFRGLSCRPYGRWLGDIFLHGTLGNSLLGDWRVEEKILARLPATVELGVMAIVIGLLIGLPAGIYSAMRRNTAADYVGRSVAIIGLATPNFWLATLILTFPAIWWAWSPPLTIVPFRDDPLGSIGVFIVPSLILGTYLAAATMRMTRTMMLEVLRQDYVRTAWSKGLQERVVIVRHAIKNALIPVVTLIGLQMPILIGGSVIMESIFSIPGLGRLMLDALNDRDYPVVSGVNLTFAASVMAINLVVDLIYAVLDPRVGYR